MIRVFAVKFSVISLEKLKKSSVAGFLDYKTYILLTSIYFYLATMEEVNCR